MLQQTKVKSITVSRYSELSVKSFWSHIKETPKYLVYFPDYKPNQLHECNFMFETLLTIDENLWLEKLSKQILKTYKGKIWRR